MYGINVNVQLVDMNTLLRAELAGEGPDVAIQVANTNGIAGAVLNTGNDTPVNYGLRNAVLDLTQFEDFDSVSGRFYDSALTAFGFEGSVYALPETQTFPVMFYRKDILAELGMEIPQTWDEVKVTMSVLAKNQMEFGMLPTEQVYAMLLYQNGGEYYNEGGISPHWIRTLQSIPLRNTASTTPITVWIRRRAWKSVSVPVSVRSSLPIIQRITI